MATPTEEPTPRRLRRALEEGDAPVSSFAGQALGFAAALAVLPAAGTALAERAGEDLRAAIAKAALPSPEARFSTGELASTALAFVAPVVFAATFAALVAAVVQSGGLVVFRRMTPRLDRLDVFAGLARTFSLARVAVVARALAFACVVTIIADRSARSHLAEVVRTVGRLDEAASLGILLARSIAARVAAVGLLFAAIDLVVTRTAWRRRHRMTRAEVERERRESEGDPLLKAARQRAHQALFATRDASALARATIVVVDGHTACALAYDPANDRAPLLVAMDIGHAGKQLIDEARALDVAIHEDVRVVRGLRALDLGSEIPGELYEPVAELLRGAPASNSL